MKHNTSILIVEDEALLALEIKETIEEKGMRVIGIVDNVSDVITMVKKEMPTFILMDIHLKNNESGINAANALREFCTPHIIYLSADKDDRTIQAAVQTDPIYYLHKPFNIDTLRTTVDLALYKLQQHEYSDPSKIALPYDYYFDPESEQLYHKAFPIRLGRLERMLLSMLINAKGNTIPYQILEHRLYPDRPVAQSTLRTLCNRLNAKMEHKVIETVPGIGYKIGSPHTHSP